MQAPGFIRCPLVGEQSADRSVHYTFVIAGAKPARLPRPLAAARLKPVAMPPGQWSKRLGHHGGEVLSRQRLRLWEFLERSLVEAQAAGSCSPSVRDDALMGTVR